MKKEGDGRLLHIVVYYARYYIIALYCITLHNVTLIHIEMNYICAPFLYYVSFSFSCLNNCKLNQYNTTNNY